MEKKYTAVRRSSKNNSPARKRRWAFASVVFVCALLFLIATGGDARKAWLKTDFETQMRSDLLGVLPGDLELDSDFWADIWTDGGPLIGRSLMVFYSDPEVPEKFAYEGEMLHDKPVSFAILIYHVTLPLFGYVEPFSQMVYSEYD